AALRGGRLQTQDLVERGHVVLDQLLVGERDLADDVVQVRRTVGAELDLAALDVGHGLGGVHRDGAVLGFGMSPRGPSTRPSLPTLPMRFGVAPAASKSVQPPATFSISSSSPTSSAPASRAASACAPVAKTMTRAVLPVPLGRLTVPRTIWSALRGSTPRRIETSTEASNLAGEDFCARRSASSGVYTRSSSIRAAPFLYA